MTDLAESLREDLRQAELEIERLRSMLAAYRPETDRPASAVTPSGGDRLKWLKTRLWGGVGMKTRDAGSKILELTELLENEDRATVVEALHRMVDETDRWKDAWSASTVNHDHQLREAMFRANDCPSHGEMITGLERQVAAFDKSREQSEGGRMALLNLLFVLREFMIGFRKKQALGQAVPSAADVVDALGKTLAQAEAAHNRAFRPPAKRRSAE